MANVYGTFSNDNLVGTGWSKVYGYGGNDTLTSQGYSDTLIGGSGQDKLVGRLGYDTTVSYEDAYSGYVVVDTEGYGQNTEHNDDAWGDQYTDISGFIGSNYNDVFYAGLFSRASINGGYGIDTISYIRSYYDVVANISGYYIPSIDNRFSIRTVSIERLEGGQYFDTLVGTTNQTLIGGLGNDTYIAYNGSPQIIELNNEGTDTVITNLTSYTIGSNLENLKYSRFDKTIDADFTGNGNNSNNIITGGLGNDSLNGLDGNDVLVGGGGTNVLNGGNGYDIADYSYSTEAIIYASADQVFHDGAGATNKIDTILNIEKVIGTKFNDQLTVNNSDVLLDMDAGAGENYLNFGTANKAVDIVIDQNDTVLYRGKTFTNFQKFHGTNFADKFIGNDHNNIFEMSPGADTIDGGAGIDQITFSSTYKNIEVNLANHTAKFESNPVSQVLNIENVISGNNNDLLIGDDNANYFQANAGDDTLIGGAGADTLDGGQGVDTVSFQSSSAGVGLDFTSGAYTGGAQGDVYIGIEKFIGSNFNDSFVASKEVNIVDGGAGFDKISFVNSTEAVTLNFVTGSFTGGDATGDQYSNIESVEGTKFNDILITSDVTTAFDGNTGFDLLSFQGAATAVAINLGATSPTGKLYTNIEAFQGSQFADTFIGDANDNVFISGAGADTIDGGDGIDAVWFLNNSTGVFANLVTHGFRNGDATGDVISNVENITGSHFNDEMYGDTSNNLLQGAGGNDAIYGGGGNDTIYGGVGDIGSFTQAQASNQADSIYAGDGDDVVITNSLDVGTLAYGLNGADNITVYAGTAYGGEGNDTLTGLRDGAMLYGEIGNDVLTMNASGTATGGWGDDVYFINNANVNVVEIPYAGIDEVRTSLSNYTLASNLERLIFTGEGNFTGIGNAENNYFQSGAGNDSLSGGTGNDIFLASNGADTIDGGDGIDAVWFLNSSTGVFANLVTHGFRNGDATGDVISNVENITGSHFNDEMYGDTSNNLLQGAGGNDSIYGGGGNDTIYGGVGDIGSFTQPQAINQADSIYAGDGDDVVITNSLDVGTLVYGQNGADNITVYAGTAYGGEGNDTLTGLRDGAMLYGEIGNDVLTMNASGTATGGWGDDIYFINNANVNVVEIPYAGIDEVRTSLSNYTLASNLERLIFTGEGNFTGIGNAENNYFQSGAGNDSLSGGAGNDIFLASNGADTIDGGDGIDAVWFLNSSTGVLANLVTHGFRNGDATGDVISNVENITGSHFNDEMYGDTSNNLLQGAGGNDSIYGGGGNDTIYGGVGDIGSFTQPQAINQADSIYAGDGDDVVITNSLDVGTLVYGQNGADNITVYAGTAYGGEGNDTLTGLRDGAMLYGEIGNDILAMNASGTAAGGWGDDVYFINNANAIVVEAAYAGMDEVRTSLDIFRLSDNVERLIYTGNKAFTAYGNASDNYIKTGAGNDLIDAGDGNDYIVANAGADSINGGNGTDDVWYLDSPSAVTVNLANNSTTGGYADGDVLSNIENLLGSNFNDLLIGDATGNFLRGGNGNDTIYGGAGDDALYGGSASGNNSAEQQADLLYGGAGNDFIFSHINDLGTIAYGQDGNDNITVYSGTAMGGNQNDQLTGKAVGAYLMGESGDDTLILYAAGKADGGEGSDKFEIRTKDQVTIEDHGTAGTDTVYLFNIATAADIATFRVNNDLIITDKTDALDGHAESGVVLPNWYGSNSNTIEAFIVGNGESLNFGH